MVETTNPGEATVNNRKVWLPLVAAVMIFVLMIGATMAAQQALGVVLSAVLGALALVLAWRDPDLEPERAKSKRKVRR